MKHLWVVLSLIFVSCSGPKEEEGKVLNIAVGAEIKGMDPIYSSDAYSSREIARIYEGLLEYHYTDRPYRLIPNLAEAMPYVDKSGKIYRFKIKKGIFFHHDKMFPEGKGRELTAFDFVYSIKRLADPRLQSLGWWLLDGVLVGLNEWRKKYSGKKTNYDEIIEGVKALGFTYTAVQIDKTISPVFVCPGHAVYVCGGTGNSRGI